MRRSFPPPRQGASLATAVAAVGTLAFVALGGSSSRPDAAETLVDEQILRGRTLVVAYGCSGCHSGVLDPAGDGYLAGIKSDEAAFRIQGFTTRPRNLTPDNTTGLGRFSERQIFNALRYGLRPGETPDVEITSHTPGQGNFPARPKYLAPPMPWPTYRHLTDQELWDIAAYLKKGVKPVANRVMDSEGPPDFWAGAYAELIGPYPVASFPTANERVGGAPRDRLERGRKLAITMACGDCHGAIDNPAAEGWMVGARTPTDTFQIGPFVTRARNLTPDSATGIGRYTERQLFNALRYGLRPAVTPDVEITSSVPGQGNFPAQPHYLAPPMPWPAWRHLSDDQLRDLVAYMKHGLKPVHNEVPASQGPPDFWASDMTVEALGPYPASPFPTRNEVAPAPAR